MIENFNHLVSAVMEYIASLALSKRVVSWYTACFAQLRAYLDDKQMSYSPDEATKWLHAQTDLSNTKFGIYKTAISRLNDLYTSGEITKTRYVHPITTYARLNDEFRSITDKFAGWLTDRSDRTISNIVHTCSAILLDLQNCGIESISEMTYVSLQTELALIGQRPYYVACSYRSVLNTLLQFLFSCGQVPYGYTLFVDCTAKGNGLPVNHLSSEDLKALDLAIREQGPRDLNEVLQICDTLYHEHVENNYSRTALLRLRRKMDEFYLFMDMNSLCYAPICAETWLESIKPYVNPREYRAYQRATDLIEVRSQGKEHTARSVFSHRNNALSNLSAWSKSIVTEFLEMKTKEGWEARTIKMYESCICRFCKYIDSLGIQNFAELTPSVVKRFNEADLHDTAEGKNAYNARIRIFLMYLGEMGYITNKALFLSLPSVYAKSSHLVVVLTDEEQAQLENIFHCEDSGVSLRDKAMLELGLYMGLRGCDIVNLKIENIDWETATIHIIQEKTDYEIVLPMPTQVANALYRYIMCERPESEHREVFLKERAPYDPVGRFSCWQSINRALPERNIHGSGFHVTRKTFATNLLRNNMALQQISEVLGHRTLANVHKYLYLDEERMKSCGFSLADKNLSMKGGFGNDD